MKTMKINRYYKLITVLCLCFLLAGISLTVYMNYDNKEKNTVYFKESTENMGNMLSNLIQSNLETLDGVARTLGQMEITNLEDLLPVIQEINSRNAFYRMGYIQAGGVGNMVDLDGKIHKGMDFSEDYFFQKALEGENTVSITMKDEYSGSYLNYYGVPVEVQGRIVGVLAAADKAERIKEVLDTSLFSKGGYFNVIDSSGHYVIRSGKSPDIEDIQDIGDFSDRQREKIQADLSEESSGFLEYKEGTSEMWAAYIPLEIEDWFLLGIEEEQVAAGSYYTTMGIVAIIATALIIFVLLGYSMNQMHQKNEQQLEYLAYTDPLLSINNYVKFSMDVQSVINQGHFHRKAFWYCDFDDFKIFNESYGYEAGDELLRYFTKIVDEFSGDHDLFCRETADHFVGIRQYQSSSELIDWYEKLSGRLERYEPSKDQIFRLTLSMGFYCVRVPSELLTVNEMYNRARMAQKSIKQTKNVKYAFYSDQIRHQLLRDNEIESRMKQALNEEAFKVFIQPKIAISENNRIVGGEALVRWKSPDRGMINPGEFIPLFEKNGFIIQLDRYMLRSVCQWLKTYLSQGNRPIQLAVNVSRLGILQDDFLDYYASVKREYCIPDGMLELEFTESMAVEDNDLLRRRIVELRKQGFFCSLDDFGSGYSSLNTLKDLPIQILKLDILFFREGADVRRARIIVEHVIRMAKQLEIRVVAEGVEEVEQVEFLRWCGCDIIQGYVFERPMSTDDFQKLLEQDPKGDWGAGFK